MSPQTRQWATPLTIGAFGLMAVTGLLMFFHLDQGLQKPAHEWLGWLMVAAVGVHAAVNWPGLKRHLTVPGPGRVIVGASALALAASFFVAPGSQGEDAPPPVLAMHAVAKAPLKAVLPLTGKSFSQVQGELAAAGIHVDSDEQSIASAIGDDRGRMGRAMRVLFS
ncbi:MAG: DUF4405 domain-containing protein [Burkholderiaceae bacterium]